jgi:hypothetical protein
MAKNQHTSEHGVEYEGVLVREDDPAHILEWHEVRDTDALLKYFMQRLGPGFRSIPLTTLRRDHFLALVNDPEGGDLYSQMWGQDPEAASEAFLAYSPRNPDKVLLSFHLESSTPGSRFTEFLARKASSPFHRELVECLMKTSRACQKLHLGWKKQGGGYHKIRTAADFADRSGLEVIED